MEGEQLLKKGIKRAVTSTGNVVTGALALGASLALANPLPAILWGLGSAVYVGSRVTSASYAQKIINEEFEAEKQRSAAKHKALRAWVLKTLDEDPFYSWMGHGLMPQYGKQFLELEATRDRIARQAHARKDVAFGLESDVHKQMNLLLAAYLRFVQSRIVFVQKLSGVRLDLDEPVIEPEQELSLLDWAAHHLLEVEQDDSQEEFEEPAEYDRTPLPSFDLDAQLRYLTQKRDAKKRASSQNGAAAKITAGHVEMLNRRIAFLKDIAARDQRATAQLEALPDVFYFMLDRIGSAHVDPSQITSYMTDVVSRVEADQEFVEEMTPSSDDLIRGIEEEQLLSL